ncbi:cytochrome d ubiquinol oxidase subunit II [Oxalobacteraceae bacterium A2-2]
MNGMTHGLLAHMWFGLMGLMLVFYVITDGFDLGAGLLSLATRDQRERDQIFAAIGHVWDANETWLVVLGGAMFGAFPAAYALLMHALYVPVMALIASLILRGAAIEFRHAASNKRGWDLAFGIGSLGAAVSQGVVLGSVITGLQPGAASMGFIAIAALGVVSGYALLGATYMIKKAGGAAGSCARVHARYSLAATVACAFWLTAATFLLPEVGHERWRQPGVLPLLAVLGALSASAVLCVMHGLYTGAQRAPFRGAVALFVFSFAGLAVSLFPDLVPGRLAITEAASDTATLAFMLCGIGLFFPVMVGYNLYQYYVFRGRVRLQH